MELGYTILAEALIREQRFDDALKATEHLPEGNKKILLMQEIRNNAVRIGRLDLYQKTSRIIGLDDRNEVDLAIMLLVNVENQNLENMLEIIELIPRHETRLELINTAIIESAFRGHVELCEKLAEKRGLELTLDEARVLTAACVRNGWISDAEKASKLARTALTTEDYLTMLIANKDKGLLTEMQEAAKRAGKELNADALSVLLLAAVKNNRATIWEIAEML